ncbi:hypothetical protein [Glaciihabitans sp. dw_435]|uniref:hypothetical protein n=1 Tax=Glaciihabitans sp. dw_435 TaxID=2720081 RepID=UPI001BD3F194|nr:hypothetical protein [Glaciihabitans sp. dw_435]
MTITQPELTLCEVTELSGLSAHTRRDCGLARHGDAAEGARSRLLRETRLRVIRLLADITTSLAAIDTKIAVYEERITRS